MCFDLICMKMSKFNRFRFPYNSFQTISKSALFQKKLG